MRRKKSNWAKVDVFSRYREQYAEIVRGKEPEKPKGEEKEADARVPSLAPDLGQKKG